MIPIFLLPLLDKKQNKMEIKDPNRLKVVLAEKKIANKWLTERFTKDQGAVFEWCTNTCMPDLANTMKIAELQNVDLDKLVRFEYKTSTSYYYTK